MRLLESVGWGGSEIRGYLLGVPDDMRGILLSGRFFQGVPYVRKPSASKTEACQNGELGFRV